MVVTFGLNRPPIRGGWFSPRSLDDHSPLRYGKEGFANPFFIAHAPGVALKGA